MKTAVRRKSGNGMTGDYRQMLQTHQELIAKLDSIERRLFKDNGTLSIQTRLDRHEQVLRVLLWVTSVTVGTALSAAVLGAVMLFKWVLSGGVAV